MSKKISNKKFENFYHQAKKKLKKENMQKTNKKN